MEKKSKRKQPELPAMKGKGVERPVIKELDDLAAEYVGVRDRRMALTKEECGAKNELHNAMNRRGLKSYVFEHEDADGNADELEVVVEPGGEETVKVRKVKKPKAESNGDGDDSDND